MRVVAEISRSALVANARHARAVLPPETGLIAVVKADAYGHGARIVVPALRDEVESFAVANIAEATDVRLLAPDHDILLLSPCLPDELTTAIAAGWQITVSSAAEAAACAALATPDQPARLHLKVDTGMGRVGVWHDDAARVAAEVARLPNVSVASISTHLPSPDDDESFTRDQLATFAHRVDPLRAIFPAARVHVLNSAGILGFAEAADRHDQVRVGLMLYGSSPLPACQSALVPVLTWKSRICLVRDVPAGRTVSYGRTYVTPAPARLATVAVGYADGYPRQASNQGACALVGGRRCPVVGRVTMDQIIVDITTVASAAIGDDVVLIGRQDEAEILAAELAAWSNTIAWHIFTGIGGRTTRVETR